MEPALQERFHAALDLYNRGRYFAAQEILDGVYQEAEPDEQPLVRALAILATAMHLHFQRGGGRGVVNLLRQLLLTLDESRRASVGVDVAQLYESVEAYLAELQQRRKPGAGFFDRWLVPRVSYGRAC